MSYRKIEDLTSPDPDEDIIAEVESSWASWYIASISAVIAVMLISAASLLR